MGRNKSNMQTAAISAPSFLIDQILPTRTVHMVSGPSGVGKTTLLLQILNDWTAGKEVLNHQSFPAPFCYINCARGLDEVRAKISNCEFTNLDPQSFLQLPYNRSFSDDVSFEHALKLAKQQVPGLRLLVLDCISVLVPGRTNEDGVISEFMRKLHVACRQDNLTIVGTGVHAKSSEGQRRARLSGSVAWGTHVSTMIVMEGAEDSEDRTVRILGDSFAPETYTFQFSPSGLLVLTTDDSAAFGALDMKLGALQPGEEFETGMAMQWGKDIGCARATIERWLKKRVEDGVIERIKRGTYKLKFTA